MLPWLPLLACKAVLTVQATAGCRSMEFDLQVADDGVWVLAHDPVSGTSADLRGRAVDFDAFVAGLKGRRFDMVNLDIKERGVLPGDGRLSRALEKHAASIAALAAQSGAVVATSPSPARYEELERYVARSGSAMKVGLELVDYSAEDARRWRLPMSRAEAAALPLARLASRAYVWWRGVEIRYLEMQERTAKESAPRAGRTIICWSRDPATGPPPEVCRWTERGAS